jgi:hypothetical protein
MPANLHADSAQRCNSHPPLSPSRSHDRVTKSESGPDPLIRGPVKSIKEAGPLSGRDSRPVVFDHQSNPVAPCTNGDLHDASLTCVAACIVNQNCSQPVNPLGRSIDPWLLLTSAVNGESNSSARGHRAKAVRSRDGDRFDIHRLGSRGRWFRIEASQPEKVLNDVPQPSALPGDSPKRLSIVIHAPRSAQRETHLGFDNTERCPEFM